MAHPNKHPFLGVLTLLDTPSDKAPTGARGHQVVLTTEAAREALPTLIGMGINVSASGDGHDYRGKCGIIDQAEIRGRELLVSGYIFAKDFPDVVGRLTGSAEYGMSYELHDARVDNMRSPVWRLSRVTFTGAAVLLREAAAFTLTDFVLL